MTYAEAYVVALLIIAVSARLAISIYREGRYHDDLDLPEIPHFTVRGGVIRPAEDPSTVLDVLGRKDHQ